MRFMFYATFWSTIIVLAVNVVSLFYTLSSKRYYGIQWFLSFITAQLLLTATCGMTSERNSSTMGIVMTMIVALFWAFSFTISLWKGFSKVSISIIVVSTIGFMLLNGIGIWTIVLFSLHVLNSLVVTGHLYIAGKIMAPSYHQSS